MLAVSMVAQATSAVFMHGPAFLIPYLHEQRGYGLVAAGTIAATATVGVVLTLLAWGAVVDRVGERKVLAVGLGLTAVAGLGAVFSSGPVWLGACLFAGGMAAASTNAASGRVVVGWFPAHRRGLAMGIRQMAQPLGVGVAAISIPPVAQAHGIGAALALPTLAAVVVAVVCAGVVIDPPRPTRAQAAASGQLANPYRSGGFLWRVHVVSVLLVVPQFTVWTYALVWLISDRGWSTTGAGVLVAGTQVLGALGRIGVGQLSDHVGSRMRPLRWVAVAAGATMLALAVTDALDWSVSVALLVIASVVTVADNGLAFTSVAEVGGPYWSGRALGAQNTAQFLTASIVPPAVGAVISLLGFPLAFALTAAFPALAVPLVPTELEKKLPEHV